MCRMLGFIMFWIAVGMIIGLIFTGSMFWHIVIIIALIIIGYNMFCHQNVIFLVKRCCKM